MSIYTKKQRWKLYLLGVAIVIAFGSFFITNDLVKKLSTEERKRVELVAEAMRCLSDTVDYNIGLILKTIQHNETVPVIVTDNDGNITSFRNIKPSKENDTAYLYKQIEKMKEAGQVIEIPFIEGDKQYIYYKDSTLLTQLFYFPIIQFGVICLFLFISYMAFSASRVAEQNQVWVGMSKETAHQLGTPTSSLMANLELLRLKNVDAAIVDELDKDIERLVNITERFSKIGSTPKLKRQDIVQAIEYAVEYIKARSSSKVNFIYNFDEHDKIELPFNLQLFEWVIENLFKNAIDSMEGEGDIKINLSDRIQYLFIDIIDNGKGIPKSKYKTVFQPGYTTKKRGWGLGLSLSKRIIENYHQGKIFVHNSDINKETTFRIVLKK